MDRMVYFKMAALEEKHWWFISRRRIIEKILTLIEIRNEADILEAGCGTGGNLKLLARYGTVYAMEMDADARMMANELKITPVEYGKLPDQIPFDNRTFDLAVLLDVLEHLDDDVCALKAIRDRLKPDAYVVLTVPAFKILWSSHDDEHHHKRRYSIHEVKQRLKNAGFSCVYSTYFNTFMFPAIVIVRLVKKYILRSAASDLSMPSQFINNALIHLFSSERFLIPNWRLPFGVSILAVARVTEGGSSLC